MPCRRKKKQEKPALTSVVVEFVSTLLYSVVKNAFFMAVSQQKFSCHDIPGKQLYKEH